MNVREGNSTGRNDVQADNFVLVVEQDHTELFPVGLAVGFDEFANDGLGLSGVGQCAGLEWKGLVSNQHDAVGCDELGRGEVLNQMARTDAAGLSREISFST